MNIGGDQGRDDYGLPPADIEVPDDARELDRDVLAYHRELRARRWRRRTRRLHRPLTRDGMVLPLLAGCLALTLLAGTLLTIFTVAGGPFGTAQHGAGHGQAAAGQVGGPLPNANVLVGGQQTPLRSLTAAVLALVPPGCHCQAAVTMLTRQAHGVGARVFLVGIRGAQVTGLATQAGLRAGYVAEDTGGVLAGDYYHAAGLTAILVRASGTVSAVVPVQGHHAELQKALRALPGGGTGSLGPAGEAPLAAGAAAAAPGR